MWLWSKPDQNDQVCNTHHWCCAINAHSACMLKESVWWSYCLCRWEGLQECWHLNMCSWRYPHPRAWRCMLFPGTHPLAAACERILFPCVVRSSAAAVQTIIRHRPRWWQAYLISWPHPTEVCQKYADNLLNTGIMFAQYVTHSICINGMLVMLFWAQSTFGLSQFLTS